MFSERSHPAEVNFFRNMDLGIAPRWKDDVSKRVWCRHVCVCGDVMREVERFSWVLMFFLSTCEKECMTLVM